ncbi:MAG TPA: hypothetical protein VF559_06495 [Caulobacteraceae bacterium]|jgi:glycosyltransferase involved in cell wall biosynthesis
MPLRIDIEGDAYLYAGPGDEGLAEPVRHAADRARTPEGSLPQAVVWDARLQGAGGLIRLGPGPLDDLLLGQMDASGCCAVMLSTLERMKARGAVRRLEETGAALAVLARDARGRVAHAEGPVGELRPVQGEARKLRPALRPELISVVLLAPGEAHGLDGFFDALGAQRLSSGLEVLVVGAGFEPAQAKALAAAIDRRTGAGGLRVRHFLLPGAFSEAYLANTGVALASGEAVVVARPACIPETADAVQTLASWTLGAEVLTASPRINDGSARLLCAGLDARPTGGGAEFRLSRGETPGRAMRRTAAPAPWFFAANRRAWLEMGGAGPRQEALWTASLAREARGGVHRHLLIESAAAVWTAARPAGAGASISTATLSIEAKRAARWVEAPAPAETAPPARPMAATASPHAAFSDEFPSEAPMRLLVFADSYGASQSICFVEGLAGSRSAGRAAVRLVEESAFAADGGGSLAEARALVEAEFASVRPTAVVVSRFGHAEGYQAVRAAAHARGLPLVLHLDDDLFELPLCVGVERYRAARHPRRIHTLHRAMAEADLTLAATPQLAERLARLGRGGHIAALAIGSAGRPGEARAVKGPDQPLVVGYMGSASHNADLEMIAPALNEVLGRFDHVSIELFGSISDQPAADLLRGRVRRRKAIPGDYAEFRRRFGALGWDIGLAPLRAVPYNLLKTPTKWVEYAEAGAAAVVSDLEPYRPMIAAGAALPARPDGWTQAISRLIVSPPLRRQLSAASRRMLVERYDWARLEASVLEAFARLEAPALAA